MAEVIELRVHGVGGSTPAQILGEESDEHTIRTAGDDVAGFYARKQNLRVEGYVWGRLTARALLQPLWLLLLPFTLVNVAGWMHRPDDESRPWARAAVHAAIRVEGFVLTIAYVLWLSAIVLEGVFYQWGLGGRIDDPAARFWWGAASIGLLGAIMLLVARGAQRGFERIKGPAPASRYEPELPNEPPPRLMARLTTWAEDVGRWARFVVSSRAWANTMRLPADEDFTRPDVWERERTAQSFLFAHAWVALITFAVVVASLRGHAGRGVADLQLEDPIRLVTLVEVMLVVMLAAAHGLGRRKGSGGRRFRWAGPAVATSTAIGLSTGFFYGLLRLAQERLARAPLPAAAGPEWRIGRPVLDLGVAFGLATVAFAVALLGLGVTLLWRAAREARAIRSDPAADDPRLVPRNSAPAGREPNGLTGTGFRLGLARASSDALSMADIVLTLPAVLFSLLVPVLVFAPWRLAGGAWTYIGQAGDYLAVAGAGGLLAFLVRRAYRPGDRRLVGIVWDVMTFFPRRHHPLAVRPYAERAIPELRHRLYFHTLAKERRVLLSAHSQGSIIAFAALACSEDEVIERISLLTYGCPLRTLYGRFFPAYFPRRLIEEMEGRLRSPDGYPEWHNFHRRTDYIGKAVFDDTDLARGGLDQELPDPAAAPRIEELDLSYRFTAWPDPVRTVWGDLALHSHYNNEVPVQTWIRDEKIRLLAAD